MGSLAHVTAQAQSRIDWNRINLDAERAVIAEFQAQDQRLQDVGWKLIKGNAPFCDGATPSIGLQLQDMASYGSPEVARAALGLTGDFAVQTAARGSPADRARTLPKNREIHLIDTVNPNQWEAGKRFYWERLAKVHDLVDAALQRKGSVNLTFADGSTSTVEAVEVCPSRFELMGDGKKAVADGNRVVIGVEFPAFDYEEPEFAGLVAHELAHNLLGHTAWLDRNGRKRSHTRMTEREADRLIPWLLANAGYDPESAVRFFRQLRPASGSLLFFKGTHPKWRERASAVEGEIAQIKQLMAREGKADWQTHFRREIDPNWGL
ncbi:hypothetical protein INR77_01330 [Erythrobacter sp. SCSIO 43205]|nr:hypothetical protein INR77_01330 [Erythrobacter sp. SCSIO 43205]